MDGKEYRKEPAIWVSIISLFVALSCLCSGYVVLAWALLVVTAYLIYCAVTKQSFHVEQFRTIDGCGQHKQAQVVRERLN